MKPYGSWTDLVCAHASWALPDGRAEGFPLFSPSFAASSFRSPFPLPPAPSAMLGSRATRYIISPLRGINKHRHSTKAVRGPRTAAPLKRLPRPEPSRSDGAVVNAGPNAVVLRL